MTLLGIELKYECPACGNILTIRHPFWTKKLRENLSEPERCGCGRRRDFTLLNFNKCDYDIVPDGHIVQEKKDVIIGRPTSSSDVFEE